MTKDNILKRLTKHYKNSKIEVHDLTGNENHYSLLIISNDFNNLSLIDRHKKIYAIFKKELTIEIHALQIRTFTLDEWTQKNI